VSPIKHQRRRYDQNSLQGELKKIKSPIFDRENKMGEYVESWLLGIRKYFPLHNYSSNLEAIIYIYNLEEKPSMWGEQREVKHINERRILGSCSKYTSSRSTSLSTTMTRSRGIL
jgi:hypothetical protein